ncbi:MAG: 16S rRNA (guanine(966)-N(2))-methyltransferase RsmD [Methylobacteriaceae bacterium]|nr:16S rRNA (guanine(966)-N(2))-methyltransferase RsmD [Methylobacteriaceae bacterium]MBV9245368.1 16S rRNA (guanine(966)-N(2))-methyltransferase RsmD [Methylobacteriaceae bacterium]MBV9635836.1 16S rRNA (guanine(966)-N(2))-methyltransferase RsmD [Methylobacteriaceae bacterium]MBV9701185.1 16S rRNA (guanine(966)-N(2))-methyltransferase RsmD [Methylobacteriaceae bacterium]
MRIVGGRFRGRPLKGPAPSESGPGSIRPTSDRLREAVFNILAHAYGDPVADARVVDLFAGTGALGLEALSRGARFALFVEIGTEARALLRGNVEALGLGGVTRIFRRDATRLGEAPHGEKFTLAFLDPPYGRNLAALALSELRDGGWLAAGALCLVEAGAADKEDTPHGFELEEAREYGDSQISFLRFSNARSPFDPDCGKATP